MQADQPFARIVVPLDGSDLAEVALERALALARLASAPLTLFRWVPELGDTDNARDYLEGVGAAAIGVDTDIVVRSADDGRVAEALVAEASRDGALICLTSRGRSRVGKFVLGSITAEILQIGVGPVLLIGPNCEPGRPLRGQRLVVCVDGSDFAERVIPVATSWSVRFDMPLWLVEVISPTGETAARPPMGDVMEGGYVASVAKTLSHHVNWDVLHSDSPAEGIVGLASAWPVGIFALATHGRTGWSRVTTGSVALSVVRDATRPVLLVRPPLDHR